MATTRANVRTCVLGLGEIVLRVNNLDAMQDSDAMQKFYEEDIGLTKNRSSHRLESDPSQLTRDSRWRQHIARWAKTVAHRGCGLIAARLSGKHDARIEPTAPRSVICVRRDRVLIAGDTLAINVQVHSGRQLWLYEHGPGTRHFLWRLERGDVVGPLRIDERHSVFDWPELIWRLRLYGYLARTRHGTKKLRTNTVRGRYCCPEEMEIVCYLSWLIDLEMRSPLYREDKYHASLLFAKNVLTSHEFLHQLIFRSWR
jgi:hypothetical protein